MFRNVTLKCLTEIAAVNASSYDEMFVVMFTSTMQQLELVSAIAPLFICTTRSGILSLLFPVERASYLNYHIKISRRRFIIVNI